MNKTLKTLLVSMILLSSGYAMVGVTFPYFSDTETSVENTITAGTWAPPDVSGACPSLYCIWPPNHKFVNITIGCIDDSEDDFEITIINITSDEPTDGCGDGTHTPDAYGIGTDVAHLRAERSGSGNPCGNHGHNPGYGNGRVYMITFIASNDYGDAEGNVTVCVPHDYHGKCNCTTVRDDGQKYNATVNNTWIEEP
jgi:chitinase